MVWKLDRLGRSLHHLIDLVADFKSRGVDFEIYGPASSATWHNSLLIPLIKPLPTCKQILQIRRIINVCPRRSLALPTGCKH
ncbi:recombinase family protein [Adhaeribacter aquaticus]|uniref:recombinase family protein n=1 Tax=Adhaeribacter aquaticus TaxID=299567 RepID=UPI002480CCAF|nr:recombinase family protein [Adhaeribacter aquaticus]